jgi:hypothetical protein
MALQILEKLIRTAQDPPDDANDDASLDASLPTVELPESGAIIHNILTFIFPVIPLVPSTTEPSRSNRNGSGLPA